MASGGSLTRADAEICRGHRVIVSNLTHRMAPWADAMVALDTVWWKFYGDECQKSFAGEMWTSAERVAIARGLRHFHLLDVPGASRCPGVINGGGNTGHATVGLAAQFGAARIVLLGFDMQRTGGRPRWHGDYKELGGGAAYQRWIDRLIILARELGELGIEVVNATRETAIRDRDIRRQDLTEALCARS